MNFKERPFTYAGYAGLLVFGVTFIISILNSFFSNFLPASVFISIINPIEVIIVAVLAAFFFYGYVVLGRRVKNDLLANLAMMSIVLIFASIVIIYALLISSDLISLASSETVSVTEFFENIADSVSASDYLTGFLETLLFIHFFIVVFWGLQGIFFGIAIRRLEHSAPEAKITGTLNIVAGATYIIFVGYFIAAIAYIYNVILMLEYGKAEAHKTTAPSKAKKK